MNTYDHSQVESDTIRAHPWTVATSDASSRYHDFKSNPGLIRTALEDFAPWSAWPAIDTFYALVEWINGPDVALESNDCAFEGPCANSTAGFAKTLQATGRLMVLWRELALNLDVANTDRLRLGLHRALNEIDRELEFGVVGITVQRVQYLAVPSPEERQMGFQLILSFWAWGDTEAEVMGNLDRTLDGLWQSLRIVTQHVVAPAQGDDASRVISRDDDSGAS
jgi:hypothetical protein